MSRKIGMIGHMGDVSDVDFECSIMITMIVEGIIDCCGLYKYGMILTLSNE